MRRARSPRLERIEGPRSRRLRGRARLVPIAIGLAAALFVGWPAAACADHPDGGVAEAARADAPSEDELTPGQRIDAVFSPLAKAAAEVMFWDPFAAFGLYDPVFYDENGEPMRDANGEIRETNVPIVVLWLVFVALFFTIKLRFINFRGFTHAIALIWGRYTDPDAPGQLTHFQALSTAISGTVGLGNIAGVAIAVSIGGPGATFWMILAGILGMASKFAECTLGVKYRDVSEDGEISGGPPYYLSRGLANMNLPRLGRSLGWLWAFFAIFGTLGGGNMFQANQSFELAAATFPFLEGNAVWFGLVLALLVGVVIIGGVEGIGKVTGRIVPVMAGVYLLSCVAIIGANIDRIGDAVMLILDGAFSPSSAQGGFLGVMVMGLRRAAFSNEAGVGTAAIAHSTAKTREPAAEGLVGLHEPFVDTVVICTMTALVLIFTGFYEGGADANGAALTAAAFGSVAPWFPYLLTVAIVLFSFSTQISFSYYGVKCFDYVFGPSFERVFGNRQIATHVYRVLFLVCVVVGAASSLDAVMAYSDMILFGLILTNTCGLVLLSSEVRDELLSYRRRLASGEIKPRDRAAADAPEPPDEAAPEEPGPTDDSEE